MHSKSPNRRLSHVPWAGVAGELVTGVCICVLGLFLPIGSWVIWPELLFSLHHVVVVLGTVALAVTMVQRRSQALKGAIVLAAYIGLPTFSFLYQAISQINAAQERNAVGLSYFLMGLGMFGQFVVLLSCLRQLKPEHSFESTIIPPFGVGSGSIESIQDGNRQRTFKDQ